MLHFACFGEWKRQCAVDAWGPILPFLIFELLHVRKMRKRSLEPWILSWGLMRSRSLLDTCKGHSLYFSLLSGWKNKVIKGTDSLKQARVQKSAKKTVVKCCDKTGERWREHGDPTEGNTVSGSRGEEGGDWRHTCSMLEETGEEHQSRWDDWVLSNEGKATPLKNRKRRRERGAIGVDMWNNSIWTLQNKSTD